MPIPITVVCVTGKELQYEMYEHPWGKLLKPVGGPWLMLPTLNYETVKLKPNEQTKWESHLISESPLKVKMRYT